jgi:IstB-like ATP binding protein
MSETVLVAAETPQILLEHHLKTLRLPTMLREYDRVARQCAVEDVDYPRYLLRMAELELLDRERRATERRIRQAKFPVTKSLDSFDFLALPKLNKAMVLELARVSSSPVTKTCCCWATLGRARPTSPSRWAWQPVSMATASASPLPPLW